MNIWIVGGWVPITGMLAGMNLSKPGMNLSKPGMNLSKPGKTQQSCYNSEQYTMTNTYVCIHTSWWHKGRRCAKYNSIRYSRLSTNMSGSVHTYVLCVANIYLNLNICILTIWFISSFWLFWKNYVIFKLQFRIFNSNRFERLLCQNMRHG